MAFDYLGSIAQKYIQFVTTIITTVVPGLNYGRLMIFIDYADQATFFVTDPSIDTITEVSSTNYAAVTKGLLKTWLQGFFMSGTTTVVELVTVTDSAGTFSPTDLQTQYTAFSERAYWKTAIGATGPHNITNNIALAKLCIGDPLSQFIYGSSDATILTATAGNEALQFVSATPSCDVPIVYHPSTTMNGALVQLGQTLQAVNGSGTYIGNKLDFLSISGWSASGAAGANLNATQAANCANQGVAFFTTLGDGTGAVALEGGVAGKGWTTPLSKNIGAIWVTNYVDTVSSILCTDFITQPGRFKNNDTYQGELIILQGQLNLFSGIGRLAAVQITAPPFAQLPAASGGVITVPNAWKASYLDNVRSSTIYGTLTLVA
jgi:hypothetical protein